MSVFDRLDQMTSRAVDAVNADEFRLVPMASTPNGRNRQDPTRQVIIGKGIFDYESVEHGVQLGVRKSYREGNDLRALSTGRSPVLSIDRKYFPEGVEEPKQGDLVSFPKKASLPDFQVVSSQRDGLSRVVLELTHRGPQT